MSYFKNKNNLNQNYYNFKNSKNDIIIQQKTGNNDTKLDLNHPCNNIAHLNSYYQGHRFDEEFYFTSHFVENKLENCMKQNMSNIDTSTSNNKFSLSMNSSNDYLNYKYEKAFSMPGKLIYNHLF
jgi:hypothetical protein